MKLTKEQLTKLIEIAEDNTMECYSRHLDKFGPKGEQDGNSFSLTERYEDELSFIVELQEQEGISI